MGEVQSFLHNLRAMIGRHPRLLELVGFVAFVAIAGLGAYIMLFWQIGPWLREGIWHGYPVATFLSFNTDWLGLRLIIDWLLTLPLTLVLVFLGVVSFWAFGFVSAKMYQCASRHAGKSLTPAQTRT